jgi:multicomponent Na+:H+ antiporter subunit G
MNPVVQVLVGALAIGGALLVLTSAVLMMRERDAYARINCLSPATSLGLPLIVLAAYLAEFASGGVTVVGLIQLLVTLLALSVVSSVASNVLARAAYLSGAPVHPATSPQDLAPPREDLDPRLDAGP